MMISLICKVCAALPQERKNELQYINRIDRIAVKYPRSREDWELLNKYALNRKYPEAAESARMVLEMSGRIPQGKGKQAKNQSGKPILRYNTHIRASTTQGAFRGSTARFPPM